MVGGSMTFKQRLFFVVSALAVGSIAGALLGGCDNHKSSAMGKEMGSNYYEKMPLSDKDSYPLKTCSNYYGWGKHPENKEKCDVWTERERKEYITDGMLPQTTTAQDFRDSKFWQLVNPNALEDKR